MEKSDQIISWSSEKLLGLGHVKFYRCSFCKRGFSNAQALGGHMNIHRRDRARLREFSSDQNLLSLDINNSVFPPPSPPSPPPDSLQQEVSLYDEAIICSPSKRLCVTYHEENDHLTSKVNYDHNPLPRPPPPPPPGPANDDLFQREVLSSYDEAIISSPSKRPCFTYEEKDHPTSKVNYDHNPPPPPPRPPPPANDDLLQREVSSYDETIISSSSKRPCVTYDEENDHLITSKVNNYDHNHEVIIGDLLQLPLFKETSLIKEASTCMDDGQVENKGMQLNHDSELDLELRLGMEPHESSIETDLRFELHKF